MSNEYFFFRDFLAIKEPKKKNLFLFLFKIVIFFFQSYIESHEKSYVNLYKLLLLHSIIWFPSN